MSSIANKVANEKAVHPERFCSSPRCLWRVKHNGRPDSPCPRHPNRAALAVEGPQAGTSSPNPSSAEPAAKDCPVCGALYFDTCCPR